MISDSGTNRCRGTDRKALSTAGVPMAPVSNQGVNQCIPERIGAGTLLCLRTHFILRLPGICAGKVIPSWCPGVLSDSGHPCRDAALPGGSHYFNKPLTRNGTVNTRPTNYAGQGLPPLAPGGEAHSRYA